MLAVNSSVDSGKKKNLCWTQRFLKEPVVKNFKEIFACSFYYDEPGNAIWPAQSVNYTNKTQYLFRIEKGVLDVFDQRVNTHFQPSEMRIPFSNMIYIGDSDTDVPCMKLVNQYGGMNAHGVYIASDGYIVLRGYASTNYYTGFILNAYATRSDVTQSNIGVISSKWGAVAAMFCQFLFSLAA